MIEPKNILQAKGLSIDRLQTFCAIVETGSIVKAANGDPVRQSLYSRQLKELENSLGLKLFFRRGRNWDLTDEGRKVVLLTRSYFHELGAISGSVDGQPIVLSLAGGESVLHGLIFPRFGELRHSFPDVQFLFSCLSTADLIESLNRGTVDLAIVREDVLGKEHRSVPFCLLEFKLVVPRVLLREKMASGLDLLRALPIGMIAGSGTYATAMTQLAMAAGVDLKIAVRVPTFPQMCAIMTTGDIAGVVPAWHVTDFPQDRFAVIELQELTTLTKRLVIAYHHKTAEMRPTIRSILARITALFA